MTARRYRDLLDIRVAWMIEQEDDPDEAIWELARQLNERGAWDGPSRFRFPWMAVDEMLTENPMWPDLFNCAVSLPPDPWKVRQVRAAVRTITDTSFWDWLDVALLGIGSLD